MRPGRHIRQLSDQERVVLRQLYRQTKDVNARSRRQMILLSADGHGVGDSAMDGSAPGGTGGFP